MNLEDFDLILRNTEGENLEFKAARHQFDADHDLPDYCAAIANGGGGKLILGVDNEKRVIGTNAFGRTHNKLPHDLLQKLGIRIKVFEFNHPDGRVLIFSIPPRHLGQIVKSTGSYLYPMRVGESLTSMDDRTIKSILNEVETDFSADIAKPFGLDDLDDGAVNSLKSMWAKKSGRKDYLSFSKEELLKNLSLMNSSGLTYAALILLGEKEKIEVLLPDAEIIFEWRQSPQKTPYDFRISWKTPFLSIVDTIWNELNSRNLRIPFQEGFIQRDIWAFNEKSIREAVLNAVMHRDYRTRGRSIFIKASPKEFFIKSPGGFVSGITIDNILYECAWRNRRLAETLEKIGLVERSGQGLNDIYEQVIRDGKGVPDLSLTDDDSVCLKIPADIEDKDFILFLEKVANEKSITFSLDELLELEQIRTSRGGASPKHKDNFLKLGIVEKVGKARGTKYILSHQYYAYKGKLGLYTKLKGTTRDSKKLLIINHLEKNKRGHLSEFPDVFPELKMKDIQNLLQELKIAGKIKHVGKNRSGYWILNE